MQIIYQRCLGYYTRFCDKSGNFFGPWCMGKEKIELTMGRIFKRATK